MNLDVEAGSYKENALCVIAALPFLWPLWSVGPTYGVPAHRSCRGRYEGAFNVPDMYQEHPLPKGLSMAQSVGGIERIGQVVYRAEAKQGEKVTEILYAAHALGHAFLRLTFARWRPPSAVERAMPPG